jgi:hypothetical protein
VADRVPERISRLVYIDAFRRSAGLRWRRWLNPRASGGCWPGMPAQPWEQVVRQAWQVTDEADLRWMLPRLRPTPFGHFTSQVRLANPATERLPRTYIRCRGCPHPGFDGYAQTAS